MVTRHRSQQQTAGRDVLRLLASTANAVKARHDEVEKELRRLEESAEEDLRTRGEQLARLAEHYLPAVTRESVGNAFVEVRGELQNVLRRKLRREGELQREWDRALDKRQKRGDELDAVTGELDALVDRREELEERLAELLDGDDAFQDLSRSALREEQELERNLARVEESRREASDKLPAYEQSRLFGYLLRRGYGTPAYKKRGLTRRLDRWVAGLVDFNKAKQSYDFLRVTPKLMSAEVDRRRDEFDRLMSDVEAIQQRVSDEIGLTEVLEDGMRVGKRRDAVLTRIEAEQAEQQAIEDELATLAGPDNDFYRQAVGRLRQFLEGLEASALEAKTRGTAGATDDRIYEEIRWLNDRIEAARSEADQLRRQRSLLGRQRTDLADLARRFQIAEYDSQRSVFPAGFDPRPDVERFLRGEASKEQVWQAVKRSQHFLPTWVEERAPSRDLMDSEFSYLLVRVLAEAAGAAIRRYADGQQRNANRGRPGVGRTKRDASIHRRARGGFTGGRGF
ncbi:MAG: hypothetical protein AAGB00_00635 [Planctomycetota bacterium]